MSEESGGLSTEYRQRVIEEIVYMRSGSVFFLSSTGEVCQICGEVGYVKPSFQQKIHIYVDGLFEFVHGKCREGSCEETSEILRQQLCRFCEYCRKQFQHTQNDHLFGSGWLCPECIESVNTEDRQSFEQIIESIRRRRFLEPKSTEELQALHINMAVHKLEWDTKDPLEELGLGRIERLRLQATLEKRLHALFRKLAAFHGIEESLFKSLFTGEVSSEDDESKNVIAKDGDIWTIMFQGNASRLRDMKGMKYIATLLQYPDRNFAATELVNLAEYQPRENSRQKQKRTRADALKLGLRETTTLGDPGETADPKTLSQLKARLAEIQKEKEEANELQNWETREELEEEEEKLNQYIRQTFGLGGKSRRSGSHPDKARINVTRAIKRVLDKIRKQDQALAAYLKSTIKTGYQVSYTPDLNNPVSWAFNIS